MSIYIGNTKIGQMYLGSTEIAEAYLGGTKVYQNGLPSGYTQLDYISNAQMGILTNVQTNGSTWELELQMDSAPSSTQIVIGSDDYGGHFFSARTNGKFGLSNDLSFDGTTKNLYIVSFSQKGISATCNGVTYTREHSSRDNKEYVSLIDYVNTSSTHYLYTGRCYGIRCTSGGTFYGIPAKRDSDNHIGLYDIANNVFYDLS